MPKGLNKGNKSLVGELFAAADPATCKCYSLQNDFSGVVVALDVPRKALADGHRTKLVDNEDGSYTVQVHSNLWYTFSKKAEKPV